MEEENKFYINTITGPKPKEELNSIEIVLSHEKIFQNASNKYIKTDDKVY